MGHRYIHEASDLPGLVEELRAGVNIMASRDMILSHHTYAHRVDDVLRFVDQHFGKGQRKQYLLLSF